jgi:hypothetical protein
MVKLMRVSEAGLALFKRPGTTDATEYLTQWNAANFRPIQTFRF